MTDANITDPLKVFYTDPHLRFKQTVFFAMQLLALTFGVYAFLTFILLHSIRIHTFIFCFFILLTIRMCYRHISWGNTIEFRASDITILRGTTVTRRVLLNSIKQIRVKKKTVTFVYSDNGNIKFALIGRIGFSEKTWQEFSKYVNGHIHPSRNTVSVPPGTSMRV
jgi:hypothetical protein